MRRPILVVLLAAFGLWLVGVPDSAGDGTALAMDLERTVASLPPRARAVLVLYDIEGWTHEEIASELGVSRQAVHKKYGRH